MTYLSKALLAAATFTALSLSLTAEAKVSKCTVGEEIETTGTIANVHDGDTAQVTTRSGTYSIRFLGIDAQESLYMGKSQGVFAHQATRLLKELLPEGTKVKLEFGDTVCDVYGRVLAQVFKGPKGNVHVNAEMLKKGLAVNYCVAPEDRYCRDFSNYVQRAIENEEGMFADPKVELPYDFRRRIDGRGHTSFVGNIRTKLVVPPTEQQTVPVADRVFFFSKGDVKLPYSHAQ